MQPNSWFTMLMSGALILMTAGGCAGSTPESIGVRGNRLRDCPKSPNCVSSEVRDVKHHIAPFQLKGDPETGWKRMVEAVESIPRCRRVTRTKTYLHAECRSRIFRFVDDLELLLDPAIGMVSVRSASRIGWSDMGVNRKRVEGLRDKLKEAAVVE